MLYKMTLQTRGKKTGYYSHPKTILIDENKGKILEEFSVKSINKGEKLSTWRLETSTGNWVRIASKEYNAE